MALNLSSLLGGGMLLKQQLFTANGTWTRPAKMAGNTVWVTIIGGGCSGRYNVTASNRWGGRGGQYYIRVPIDIGSTTSISCTVGAGGAVPANDSTQNPGSASSFGSFLTALGGSINSNNTIAFSAPGGVAGTNPNGADTPLGYGGRVLSVAGGGGGGGLSLGISPPVVPFYHAVSAIGAQGYGAGGSGVGATDASVAGLGGAILVEWPEFV